MTIQSIPGGMLIPQTYHRNNAPAVKAFVNMTNASGKVSVMFAVPKTGNVRKVVWATRNVATGATVAVRLESLDTSNRSRPSGSLIHASASASQVVASSDDNKVFATTLSADIAVTQGQIIAAVIANASPGAMEIACAASDQNETLGFPLMADYDGANWIYYRNSYLPMLSLEYDDGTYAPIHGVYPATSTVTSITMNTGTTPDVGGMRFSLPFAARVRGCWLQQGGDGDFVVKLVTDAYNQGAGTGVLASVAFDKDWSGAWPNHLQLLFDVSVDLSASTTYRLLVEPSSASNVEIYYMGFESLAHMDAWEGGAHFCLSTAKDPTSGASWTDYNSGTFRQAFMGLLLDGFDAGGGGSGSAYAFA